MRVTFGRSLSARVSLASMASIWLMSDFAPAASNGARMRACGRSPVDLREKIRREHALGAEVFEQVLRLVPRGHRQARLLDVALRLAHDRHARQGRRPQHRFDEVRAQHRRDAGRSARAPAAWRSASCRRTARPRRPRRAGARRHAPSRAARSSRSARPRRCRTAGRTPRRSAGIASTTSLGRHVVLVVLGMEVARRDARVRHLVVALRVEADREAARRLPGHRPDHAGDRRAVGAAREEGADARVVDGLARRLAQHADERGLVVPRPRPCRPPRTRSTSRASPSASPRAKRTQCPAGRRRWSRKTVSGPGIMWKYAYS